jgi:hypothetical protein
MRNDYLINVIILHISLSLIYTVLILFKKSVLTPANVLPILLIPFFGLLAALAAEWQTRIKSGNLDLEAELEPFTLTEDIYWKTIQRREETKSIVPLEEALLINDRMTRKKLIFEMLLDDPMKNLDILLLARENNDADTAHYANTTIAKIQRSFQLQLQKLAVAYEQNPQDAQTLDRYIDMLGKFIQSGLSEAYLQHKQRLIFANLLDHKLALSGMEKEALMQKIRNSLELKDFSAAFEAAEDLKINYPDDQDTWINQLLVGVEARDPRHLKETISEIRRRKIDWAPDNKEIVQPWMGI